MKIKLFITYTCCAVMLLFSSCQKDAPQLSKEEIMSGCKTLLLYGNVSKVSYPDGSFVKFNQDGNIVEEKDAKRKYTYKCDYIESDKYTRDGQPYVIIYTDSTRSEVWDNPAEQLGPKYTFDSQGRLMTKSNIGYGWSERAEYHYHKKDLLPYKIIETFSDETGSNTITSLYTYTKLDEKQNWLSCDVEETMEYEDYESEGDKSVTNRSVSLTREIEYSLDPAFVTPIVAPE